VFNFTIISNGFAAQCIHLKTLFLQSKWVVYKANVLGSMYWARLSAGINQQSSSQFRRLVCLVPAHRLVFFWFPGTSEWERHTK